MARPSRPLNNGRHESPQQRSGEEALNSLFRLLASMSLAILLAAPASVIAQPARPFVVAETKRSFDRLADAVASIGELDGTIQIAPGRYADCAVQRAGRITFIARESGQSHSTAVSGEGKATLVLRGRGAIVQGLRFTHVTVPDGNGAGIRAGTVRFARQQQPVHRRPKRHPDRRRSVELDHDRSLNFRWPGGRTQGDAALIPST